MHTQNPHARLHASAPSTTSASRRVIPPFASQKHHKCLSARHPSLRQPMHLKPKIDAAWRTAALTKGGRLEARIESLAAHLLLWRKGPPKTALLCQCGQHGQSEGRPALSGFRRLSMGRLLAAEHGQSEGRPALSGFRRLSMDRFLAAEHGQREGRPSPWTSSSKKVAQRQAKALLRVEQKLFCQ